MDGSKENIFGILLGYAIDKTFKMIFTGTSRNKGFNLEIKNRRRNGEKKVLK